WFGGVELISSGFRSGDGAVGLDDYGFNLVEGSISGPLLFKKDADGNKTRPLLGLFLSGNYQNEVDSRPTFGGVYRIKDESLQGIIDNPLRQNIAADGSINGALYNADFLRADDFDRVPTRQNVGRQQANLVAKIDVNTSETMSLTFGGTAAFTRQNDFSRANSLMNFDNNGQQTFFDWRVYGKFSQRFISDEEDENAANTLKNVFYSVMVDYSQSTTNRQDADHKDDFFKYGHVGKFEIFDELSYERQFNDQGGFRFVHNGWQDTLVTFTPGSANPDLAAINNQYFSLFDADPFDVDPDGPYTTLLNVQNGNAILNGQRPPATYNLWTYPGVATSGIGGVADYSESNNTQFRITAAGSGDIGDHALQIGFEYEQRRDNFFTLAPQNLWLLARLNTNAHIQELDFSDSTVTNIGSDFYVTYDRLIGSGQFQFDRSLREALGLDPNGNDFINVDALDPEFFTLDMFSADELLNQGNNLVNYSGYDAFGNRTTGARATIEDFFNATDDNGNRTRPIAPYEPIYIAGYVMDKFSFDDIIFNVGVRVDRFDANQKVLKDPYVVGEAYSVGDIRGDLINSLDGSASIPTNIGDDYVVYVNDIENPTAITGFRTGDQWFNASGTEITDPQAIASSTGEPAPWLV
ncbi:MAG: hypothetical protein AAF193_05610, partial [Bacteroidota bacterium]